MKHDSAEARRMRAQMGHAAAGLMDITDAEVAAALRTAEALMRELSLLLAAHGVPLARRLPMLLGIALAAITPELQ